MAANGRQISSIFQLVPNAALWHWLLLDRMRGLKTVLLAVCHPVFLLILVSSQCFNVHLRFSNSTKQELDQSACFLWRQNHAQRYKFSFASWFKKIPKIARIILFNHPRCVCVYGCVNCNDQMRCSNACCSTQRLGNS